MSGWFCDDCKGVFQVSGHPCGVKLRKELNEQIEEKHQWLTELNTTAQERAALSREVEKLHLEIMRRDTLPDFEQGEYAGQDAMLRHIGKLDELNNSQLALAVKRCYFVQTPLRVLKTVADALGAAGYVQGSAFNSETARDLYEVLCVLQKRCELASKDLVQDDG